jgi:hypothetical protein
MNDVLVDGDLTLRRAILADAGDIAEVYNEADVQHWMLWAPEEYDEAKALANVERSEQACPGAASGCRSRRTTRGLRPSTSGSGWSWSARTATSA